MKAWDCVRGCSIKEKACWIAITRQSGQSGIKGRGRCTTCSQYRAVMLQCHKDPQEKNWKSDLSICWAGSKEDMEIVNRWLLLSMPKKETMDMAQNQASKLKHSLSCKYIWHRRLGVMGSFWGWSLTLNASQWEGIAETRYWPGGWVN